MNDKTNTFERLVLTLESSQRQDMLRQLAEITELEEEDAIVSRKPAAPETVENLTPDIKLLEESFFVRLWFTIAAFFNSSSPSLLYSDHLVTSLGKKLDTKYNLYIDTRHGFYTDEFYQEILKLKKTQIFFLTLLSGYENNKGGFSIILASLMMKKTYEAILKTTDPFSIPVEQDIKKDIRLSFIREMDSVFLLISEDERFQMYQAIQAIEWIRHFCTLPLERILMRFSIVQGGKPICMIDTIGDELKEIVNVLSSAKKIPVLLLEGLFLFNIQDKINDDKFDFEKECSVFVSTASDHLSGIRQFKSNLILADFVRYAIRDVTWKPSPVEGGEDWFVLFKNAVKKRFDDKWASWNCLHRKAMLEKNICLYLGKPEMPLLQYHPWNGMWIPLTLQREFSICFLKGFSAGIYTREIMKPLKILLIDGDFYRRENLVEYTDAFSSLENLQQQIDIFENRLSSKGDIGEGFSLISKDMAATIKGKARLENLMFTTSSDAEQIISRAKTAFRSIDVILGGILGVVRGGQYETLVNMAAIQGKQNERYRKELENVRRLIRSASELLSDAEVIEKEEP